MSDDPQKTEILQETRRNLNAGKTVFARFELERELGSGGMGVVWLAKDLEVEGRVALKFLPGLVRDPIAERDLRDEVKNARDLVHENIVSVRTLHKDDASIAVEMEFVDGPNLTMLIRDAPNRFLEVNKAAPIVRGLCLAIDHAWNPPRRLVHRDIKPHNLLVDSAGHVKVVDFGIAHTVSETVCRLTGGAGSERVAGTLPYMSPQQLKGEVHHSGDIYSIGATIYHMLTGTPPFRASDAAVLTQQINHEVPVSMTERRKQLAAEGRPINNAQAIPRVWEETVAACLAKDPAQRPASAREIAVRLGLVEGKRGTTGGAKKSPVMPMAIAAVALVAAGGGLWYWNQVRPPEPVREPQVARAVVTPTSTAPTKTVANESPSPSPSPAAVTAPPAAVPIAAAATPPPVVVSQPAAVAAPITVPPRASWQLLAAETVRVLVTRESDGGVEFDGVLNAGDKQKLPVDKALLILLVEGKGLAADWDGQKLTPLASSSGRWLITVPANAEQAPTVKDASLPFEAEVGPLWHAGLINQLEVDWLRAALAGDKGEKEQALVRRLFAKTDAATLGQWRARTTLKFKPDAAALTSPRPALMAHAIDLALSGSVSMRLLRVEPGSFRHGSAPDELGRRPSDFTLGPAVIAKPFFIGVFEVTQAEYEAMMKNSPSYWRGNPTWPVDQVTWSAMMGNLGFIAKVNAELGKSYEGLIVADLPTDDEWEYACRAGTTTALSNGQNLTNIEADPALKNIARYNKAEGGPRAVGSLEPNAWGLYDMHGNLQEWTKDGVVRGGSWSSKAAGCRSAARIQMSRDASASNQTGFRIVLRIREAK